MALNRTRKLPPFGAKPDIVGSLRRLATAVNGVIDGRTENFASVTLASSTTKTTVADPSISENSSVLLTPTNSAAASGVASTYVSAVRNGEFDITHPSSTAARTFAAAFIG